MPLTNVQNLEYFHKVVDCQWACPAHTNVPEYIRLIAQGRYADAYMLNRQSNVFPGILGRTCDRPCEPACRRGRVEEKPVAICRLKRVAADLRGDVSGRLPRAPAVKNGKRVALVGSGPASLVVANDLMPLGYEITMFEALPAPGGLMRSNIPAFRLPERVLDEEIDAILGMGVDVRYGTRIESLRALLAEGYDAVFVGTGAPRGKDLDVPGRKEAAANVHIGIDWLQAIAFGHVSAVGAGVLVIGVGNTAMDCCRSAARLGAASIKVMARKPRRYFKASPWELEDAEEERIEIVVDHEPRAFVVADGRLTGMELQRYESSHDADGRLVQKPLDVVFVPADDVILALGQENAFPWIERDLGVAIDARGRPVVDAATFQSTRPGVFFGGDAAFGPKNIIWAVEHGHQAAISIHNHCQGVPVGERPPYGMTLASAKMGLHEWAYANDYDPGKREKMVHVDLAQRFTELDVEVELGFSPEQAAREVERCLNCDVQTVFSDRLCIECDACIDICPVLCLTITAGGAEDDLRSRLSAPALNPEQDLFASNPLPQTGRVMVKDEDLCVHCGLCAERCPTAAWDMQKFELLIPYAGKRACSTTR
ncbi:MAG: glutamate synthase [Polyangiaceae bacterium UTPRO1]|nr:FAD-dependent oxidoreductase [Myxococcales bacterium]OQY64805.1 MAG: glutamate synthase [Polyangiaceae bacterium UTPRO1]